MARNERRVPQNEEEQQQKQENLLREARELGEQLAATMAGMDVNKKQEEYYW